jgi:hypothetical protein
MRFAYLTTDVVNEALALEMAQACGVALEPLRPTQGLPDARYDAVLIDWDFWPPEARAEFLAGLCDGLPPWRVGVHGYSLEDGLVKALLARGVVVSRCLRPNVIGQLREALAPAGASDASARGGNHFEGCVQAQYKRTLEDASVGPLPDHPNARVGALNDATKERAMRTTVTGTGE